MASCNHDQAPGTFGWCPTCNEPYDRRFFCFKCHNQVGPEWTSCPSCKCRPSAGRWQALPWQIFNRIVLCCQLDRGGQGAVYIAKVDDFEGYQAVKVAVQSGGMTPEAIKESKERFNRECFLQGSLGSYDSIVRAKQATTTPAGIPLLVMELIRGRTLQDYLGQRPDPKSLNPTRSAAMDPLLAVHIIRGLCHAVDCMHYHRIIHRDIKPGNIFLTPDGKGKEKVKLGDLGLAWAMEKDRVRSPDPLPNGSPLYMSPEQVLCSDHQGPPSDIYSIGVVAYEMLTARMPYEINATLLRRELKVGAIDIRTNIRGPFFAGWLKAHVYGDLIPPQKANPDLQPVLSQILQDCLCRDMGQRIQKVSDLLARLEIFEKELSSRRQEWVARLEHSLRRADESVDKLEQYYARVRPSMDLVVAARTKLRGILGNKTDFKRSIKELKTTSDALVQMALENRDLLQYLDQEQGLRLQMERASQERSFLSGERDRLAAEVERLKAELQAAQEQLEVMAEKQNAPKAGQEKVDKKKKSDHSHLDVTDKVDLLVFPAPSTSEERPPSASFPRLVCICSTFPGLAWSLTKPQMVAGRVKEQDIYIDHTSVSRRHARFYQENSRWHVEDLGSSNGVRINGMAYGKTMLKEGDMVDLGHIRLRFVGADEDFVFSRDVDIVVIPE